MRRGEMRALFLFPWWSHGTWFLAHAWRTCFCSLRSTPNCVPSSMTVCGRFTSLHSTPNCVLSPLHHGLEWLSPGHWCLCSLIRPLMEVMAFLLSQSAQARVFEGGGGISNVYRWVQIESTDVHNTSILITSNQYWVVKDRMRRWRRICWSDGSVSLAQVYSFDEALWQLSTRTWLWERGKSSSTTLPLLLLLLLLQLRVIVE